MKVWRKQASLRPSSCSSQQGSLGRIITKTCVIELMMGDGSRTSCIYEPGDATFESLIVCKTRCSPCSSGSLLLPTSAGTLSCDTIKMGEAIVLDHWSQACLGAFDVLVHPGDPDARSGSSQ